MQRPRGLAAVAAQVWVVATLLCVATTAHAQQGSQRYLIEFREYGPGAAALVRAFGGTPVYEFPNHRTLAASLPEQALTALRNAPGILRIELDAERYPLAQTTPYGISMVQADQVPAGGGPNHPMVCVIDSGYSWGHADLPGPTGTPPSGDSDIAGAGDWHIDNCGHGTHVAGTIAALGNALGVVGVIPDGRLPLHIVKVFNDSCTWAYSSDLVAALNRCTAAGAKIVSMSLGGGTPTTLEEAAFDDAYLHGILPIAAAGNGGNTALSYPAGYSSVMSIGAVGQDRGVAGFSQKNPDVELVAPGLGVLSTVPWTNENSLAAGDAIYYGNWIENGGRNSGVTGALVSGALCNSVNPLWNGKVVLCERGIITFLEKVTNVQTAGGIAAVVYNNVSGNFLGTLGDGASSTIPAISLSREDGLLVLALAQVGQDGRVVSWVDSTTDGYEAWDGTSMATPHVSGVAALLWSHNPTWTNDDIRRTLQTTALDLGQAGIDSEYGYGLVQALTAYNLTYPPFVQYPTGLSGTGSKVKSTRQAKLTWSYGSDRVSVFRNGVRVAIAVPNTGKFTDLPPSKGNSFLYKVCEAHGATSSASPSCSNEFTVRF